MAVGARLVPRAARRVPILPRMTTLTLPGRFAAAVFDVDGLLVDTEPVWAAAETDLLARYGHIFTEEDRLATVGRPVETGVAVYGQRIGLTDAQLPALRAELLALFTERTRTVAPQPGARELVSALRGRMPLGVASGSPRSVVEAVLEGIGLIEAFDVIVTSDEVVEHKPAPDAYLLACRLLAVDPRDAVAFEDSTPGIRSATAAGLYCVAVPTDGADASAADLVVPGLDAVQVEGASR
jgi:HAD superfamily hydrolase (TIGR01509 family)